MPWWFPGAGFKKEARDKWVPHVESALHSPYETVKRQMVRKPLFSLTGCPDREWQVAGTAKPSVAASMIGELDEKSSEEERFTSMAIPATMYLGVSRC